MTDDKAAKIKKLIKNKFCNKNHFICLNLSIKFLSFYNSITLLKTAYREKTCQDEIYMRNTLLLKFILHILRCFKYNNCTIL